MNHDQWNTVTWWLGAPYTVNTTIDALVRMAYTVKVSYTPGGIVVNITRAGRGQEHSGLEVMDVLGELMARMIEAGDLPRMIEDMPAPEVAPVGEVKDAGQEVQVNQEPEAIRGAEEERLQQGKGGADLEQHSEAGKAPKAKKVRA